MAEPMPTPAQIEQRAEAAGTSKATMPLGRTWVLAMMAGLFIGLGAAFMVLVKSDASLGFAASSVLGGLCFSVGLFCVLTAGAELFTGNSLMVCGLLSRRYGWARLLRSWGLVWLGNLAGSLFCVLTAGAELFTGNSLMVCGLLSRRYGWARLLRSWGLVWLGNLAGSLVLVGLLLVADFGSLNGGAVAQTAATIAATKAGLPLGTVFGRAVLCNLLVCVAVWMGFAATSVPGKLCCAVMPVMAFVACGFEHCVANMAFLPYGMACAGTWDWAGLLGNLAVSTLGNLVGGVVLVGCAYWLAYREA